MCLSRGLRFKAWRFEWDVGFDVQLCFAKKLVISLKCGLINKCGSLCHFVYTIDSFIGFLIFVFNFFLSLADPRLRIVASVTSCNL